MSFSYFYLAAFLSHLFFPVGAGAGSVSLPGADTEHVYVDMPEAIASLSALRSWLAKGEGVMPLEVAEHRHDAADLPPELLSANLEEREQEIEVQKEPERGVEVHHESEQEPKVLVLSLCLMSGLSIVSLAHRTLVSLLFYRLSSPAILRIKLQLTQHWKFRTGASERLQTNQRCAKKLHRTSEI